VKFLQKEVTLPAPSPFLNMYIKCWSIRGLVGVGRQVEVQNLVLSNHLTLVGFVEMKVSQYLFASISGGLLNN